MDSESCATASIFVRCRRSNQTDSSISWFITINSNSDTLIHYIFSMAKSLRSKVKRSFRTKKRETGIYAATEAARLDRLHSKLAATAIKDKDGDVPVDDVERGDGLGWYWSPIFGLLDHTDINVESMDYLTSVLDQGLRKGNGTRLG